MVVGVLLGVLDDWFQQPPTNNPATIRIARLSLRIRVSWHEAMFDLKARLATRAAIRDLISDEMSQRLIALFTLVARPRDRHPEVLRRILPVR
jgi:hypothetical protein